MGAKQSHRSQLAQSSLIFPNRRACTGLSPQAKGSFNKPKFTWHLSSKRKFIFQLKPTQFLCVLCEPFFHCCFDGLRTLAPINFDRNALDPIPTEQRAATP